MLERHESVPLFEGTGAGSISRVLTTAANVSDMPVTVGYPTVKNSSAST
jgi:hypothetical protein